MQQLCQATSVLGVNNRIVCLSAECQEKEVIETPQALIYCYPLTAEIASCGFSWSLWQDFKRLSNWADVVHYQFPWPFADFLALTRQNRTKPSVISYQSDIVRQKSWYRLYRPLMKCFLNKATAVVATSPKYIESSLVLNALQQEVTLIPNGIGAEPELDLYQQEIKTLEKTHNKGFFLFIGVFRYYKGLVYLLEAAKITGLPLVVVGDGPERAAMVRYIDEHKITNVRLLGRVSDQQKFALISLAKALVLPSSERSEAYGMVLLEAARQSTPMITTELGSGTSYINIHGETGWVVPPKNAPALAKAMEYLESHDAELDDMGRLAKERFEANFTANIMGKRYQQLYQRLSS